MNNSPTIRNAKTHEAEDISELAMRSKAFWGYSAEFMEACREELTVTAENLTAGHIRYMVAEQDSKLLGYYALEKRTENEYELEALFVDPAHIGTGVGKTLMDHAKSTVKESGGKTLVIQGDPNAEEFYRAAGGRPIGMRKSASISGRNLPLFIIELTSETVTKFKRQVSLVTTYDLIVGDPWDFSGPDGENRIELACLGCVDGPDEENWDSRYLLFQVLQPFDYSGNSVQQLVAAPRYEGESLSKVRRIGGMVGVARVINSTGLRAKDRFGSDEVEYIIIGELKRRW